MEVAEQDARGSPIEIGLHEPHSQDRIANIGNYKAVFAADTFGDKPAANSADIDQQAIEPVAHASPAASGAAARRAAGELNVKDATISRLHKRVAEKSAVISRLNMRLRQVEREMQWAKVMVHTQGPVGDGELRTRVRELESRLAHDTKQINALVAANQRLTGDAASVRDHHSMYVPSEFLQTGDVSFSSGARHAPSPMHIHRHLSASQVPSTPIHNSMRIGTPLPTQGPSMVAPWCPNTEMARQTHAVLDAAQSESMQSIHFPGLAPVFARVSALCVSLTSPVPCLDASQFEAAVYALFVAMAHGMAAHLNKLPNPTSTIEDGTQCNMPTGSDPPERLDSARSGSHPQLSTKSVSARLFVPSQEISVQTVSMPELKSVSQADSKAVQTHAPLLPEKTLGISSTHCNDILPDRELFDIGVQVTPQQGDESTQTAAALSAPPVEVPVKPMTKERGLQTIQEIRQEDNTATISAVTPPEVDQLVLQMMQLRRNNDELQKQLDVCSATHVRNRPAAQKDTGDKRNAKDIAELRDVILRLERKLSDAQKAVAAIPTAELPLQPPKTSKVAREMDPPEALLVGDQMPQLLQQLKELAQVNAGLQSRQTQLEAQLQAAQHGLAGYEDIKLLHAQTCSELSNVQEQLRLKALEIQDLQEQLKKKPEQAVNLEHVAELERNLVLLQDRLEERSKKLQLLIEGSKKTSQEEMVSVQNASNKLLAKAQAHKKRAEGLEHANSKLSGEHAANLRQLQEAKAKTTDVEVKLSVAYKDLDAARGQNKVLVRQLDAYHAQWVGVCTILPADIAEQHSASAATEHPAHPLSFLKAAQQIVARAAAHAESSAAAIRRATDSAQHADRVEATLAKAQSTHAHVSEQLVRAERAREDSERAGEKRINQLKDDVKKLVRERDAMQIRLRRVLRGVYAYLATAGGTDSSSNAGKLIAVARSSDEDTSLGEISADATTSGSMFRTPQKSSSRQRKRLPDVQVRASRRSRNEVLEDLADERPAGASPS